MTTVANPTIYHRDHPYSARVTASKVDQDRVKSLMHTESLIRRTKKNPDELARVQTQTTLAKTKLLCNELGRVDMQCETDGQEWNAILFPKTEQKDEDAVFAINGRNCKKCGNYLTDFKNSREVFRKYLSSMGWDENHPQAKLYKFREYPEHMVCKCGR